MMRFAAPLCALFLLAACGDDPAPADDGRDAAGGEILPGSVSDDMLPLDSLRSEGMQSEDAEAGEDADGEARQATGGAAEQAPEQSEPAAAPTQEAAEAEEEG